MAGKYFVYIPKQVRKSLLKIPSPWIERMEKVINTLETDPYAGEKMNGDMKDKRKIKIWPYRIVYKIDEARHLIVICEAEHRGNVSYD